MASQSALLLVVCISFSSYSNVASVSVRQPKVEYSQNYSIAKIFSTQGEYESYIIQLV